MAIVETTATRRFDHRINTDYCTDSQMRFYQACNARLTDDQVVAHTDPENDPRAVGMFGSRLRAFNAPFSYSRLETGLWVASPEGLENSDFLTTIELAACEAEEANQIPATVALNLATSGTIREHQLQQYALFGLRSIGYRIDEKESMPPGTDGSAHFLLTFVPSGVSLTK